MSPMNTVDAELLAAVRGCYGAVRMRDLEPTRTQRRHIASLVRAGELIAHEHGVVGIPGAERAVVLARIHGGLLTCQAAMRYYGLPVAQGAEQIHLVVAAGGQFSAVGREVLHGDRSWTRISPTSYPVQPLPEALARFLRCHVQDDSPLIALDAALHDERVTAEQVRGLLRGPGSARALARLDRASDRARSPLETLARMDFEAAGLSFEDGVEIEGVGEVDLVIEGWVVVELTATPTTATSTSSASTAGATAGLSPVASYRCASRGRMSTRIRSFRMCRGPWSGGECPNL